MIRVAIGLLILILFELSCIVSPAQTIVTIAGTGEYGFNGDIIIATNAQIGDVPRFCVDNCGNIYFSDGYIVREVDANSGLITRYAGIGSSGFSGDGGTALDAQFNSPTETAVDQFNNVYVGDALNYRIRKVNALTNIITTYAGNGIHSGSGIDGIQATSSAIYTGDFAFDRSGNMFLCDSNRIRKVDTAGIITTVAGTGDTGYTFSNIPATLANFSCWPAINTDYVGNFYFVDGKGSVQKVNVSTGLISRVAGSGIGVGSYLGDGIQALAVITAMLQPLN